MVDPNQPNPAGPMPASLHAALAGACGFSDEQLPDPLPAEPFSTLAEWLALASSGRTQPNPNAMTLATVGPDGQPSARIVLARGVDVLRGVVTFYTNYQSHKGRDIEANPRVALCFHWDQLDRQVRVEGLVARCPAMESDVYFRSRPALSRVAAWASDQSQPVTSRQALMDKNDATERRFGIGPGSPARSDMLVPRPPHWGGYRVYASAVELWRGHTNRLHDRARYERTLTPAEVEGTPGYIGGPWRATRLQP
jgi:pyridoxamine 5'-phosphate oxidase